MQGVSTLDLGQDTVMGPADQEVVQPLRPAHPRPCSTVSLPEDMPCTIYEVRLCPWTQSTLGLYKDSCTPVSSMSLTSVQHVSWHLDKHKPYECQKSRMTRNGCLQGVMENNLQLLRETHLMDRDYFMLIMTLVKASSEICYHKIRRTG